MKNINLWLDELRVTVKGDFPKPLYDVPNNTVEFGVSDKFTTLLGQIHSLEIQLLLQGCYDRVMSVYSSSLLLEIRDAFMCELMDQETLDAIKAYIENHQHNKVLSKQSTFSECLMTRICEISDQLSHAGIDFERLKGNLIIKNNTVSKFLFRFTCLSFQDVLFSQRGDVSFNWQVVGYEENEDYSSKAEDDDDHWNPFAEKENAIVIALIEAEDIERASSTIDAYFVYANLNCEQVADDYELPEDTARAKATRELMAFSKSKSVAIKQRVMPEIPLFFVLPGTDPKIKTQIVRNKSDWKRIHHMIPDNLKQMLIDMMATCVPLLTFWFVNDSDNIKPFVYSLYGETDTRSLFYGKYPYRSPDCPHMEYMFFDDKTLDMETAGMLSNHFNIFTMIPVTSLISSRSRLEENTALALLEEF